MVIVFLKFIGCLWRTQYVLWLICTGELGFVCIVWVTVLSKFDVGESSLDFGGVMIFMVSNVLETHWRTFPHDCVEIGWIELKFELFYLAIGIVFSRLWVPFVGYVTNFV